ncbi:MAG: hypothetical protein ACRCW2_13065 [Cellulosilyticaceae bacterium]
MGEIVIKGITKCFEKKQALMDVSFTVEEGSFFHALRAFRMWQDNPA